MPIHSRWHLCLNLLLAASVAAAAAPPGSEDVDAPAALIGTAPGEVRTIAGTALCWCPPGRFDMGSPRSEPERRPFEFRVAVTLTHGFWTGKYEVTPGDWKRVVGKLPGETTDELPADDELPVGNVSFAEAEQYCAKLTDLARAAGELPAGWEFRLPTEAQWEYACRAGTTTATSFGDSIGSQQANTKGDQPYNGANHCRAAYSFSPGKRLACFTQRVNCASSSWSCS
ncbi:MAG: formylglycine-generating enzyme family protein [Pirellulales bacterium]